MENFNKISINPATQQTGAGVNKYIEREKKLYETLTYNQVEEEDRAVLNIQETVPNIDIYISDRIVSEANIKLSAGFNRNEMDTFYKTIIHQFEKNCTPKLNEDQKAKVSIIQNWLLQNNDSTLYDQVLSSCKEGAGVCFSSNNNETVLVKKPIEYADFNLPFACISSHNKGKDGVFSCGLLHPNSEDMTIVDNLGHPTTFSTYMGESSNGYLERAMFVNRSNGYDYGFDTYGKGRSGFGKNLKLLITIDTLYTLRLSSTKTKWHQVRMNIKPNLSKRLTSVEWS